MFLALLYLLLLWWLSSLIVCTYYNRYSFGRRRRRRRSENFVYFVRTTTVIIRGENTFTLALQVLPGALEATGRKRLREMGSPEDLYRRTMWTLRHCHFSASPSKGLAATRGKHTRCGLGRCVLSLRRQRGAIEMGFRRYPNSSLILPCLLNSFRRRGSNYKIYNKKFETESREK